MTALASFEVRCDHDMLAWPELGLTSCSICKGLPWDPVMAPELVAELEDDQPEGDRLRWFTVAQFDDRRLSCVKCDDPLDVGVRGAWSALHGGALCASCAEAA